MPSASEVLHLALTTLGPVRKTAVPTPAASDCLAQPQDEALESPTALSPSTPGSQQRSCQREVFQGTPTHRPSPLAGMDSPAIISTVNCSAECVPLLPGVPTDPRAHSQPILLPPTTHVCTLSTRVPRTLEAQTKLTHLSKQPTREDCRSWPRAFKLTRFIKPSEF